MNSVDFVKFSGSGNDFICIDNRDGRYDEIVGTPRVLSAFVRACCRRGLGIGADGVIFACPNEVDDLADVAARHFEPDGSEAELCGNGVACFTRWMVAGGGFTGPEIRVLTSAGVVRGNVLDDGYVRACLPLPETIETHLKLPVLDRTWDCDFAVVGVPHVVAYVDDLDAFDLHRWGPAFRYHRQFQPRGANANFVKVLNTGRLALRTWEFGVEGETLACGTGSAAACLTAARRLNWPRPRLEAEALEVVARSGDVLRVYATVADDDSVTDLCLETVVRRSFTGRIHDDLLRQAARDAADGAGD